MIEPLSPPAVCRMCGDPLDESRPAPHGLCPPCAATQPDQWPQANAPVYPAQNQPPYPPPAYPYAYPMPGYQVPPPQPPVIDPDHPRWGIWSGIGIWGFSVAALFVAQIAAVFLLYVIDQSRGLPVPMLSDQEALREWLLSPRIVAASVYSTIGAHLLTVLFCWAIVTRFNKQPFFASLGWTWAGLSPFLWLAISVAVFIGINLANAVFERVLPQKETSFDELLKTGPQVRLAVAILASFSAPLVEEIVYRGVIFGGLRKRFSAATTITVVTILFAGVHVVQYAGAWASLAGLTLLSFVLTLIRAKTKSLLPSIVIHFVNNAVVSVFLVLGKGNV